MTDITDVMFCTPLIRQSKCMSLDDFTVYHYRELCDIYQAINSKLLEDKGDWDYFVRFCYDNSTQDRAKDFAQVREMWYQENMQ